MFMRKFRPVLVAPLLLLAACSTPQMNRQLAADARDKIVSTEVVAPVHQSEVYIYVPPSTGGSAAGAAFGLLGAVVGAVIDSSVNAANTKSAEAAIVPVRDALVDYKFDETLRADMKAELSQVAWLGVHNDVRVVKEITNTSLDAILVNSADGSVLFTAPDYQLSDNCGLLTITLHTSYFGNNYALRAMKPSKGKVRTSNDNALYYSTITYDVPLYGATKDRARNIGLWAANNGALVREALDKGLQKLAWILAADLQRSDAEASGEGRPVKVGGIAAVIVATDSEGAVVRYKTGALKYVPNYQLPG